MTKIPPVMRLDYLREYALGARPTATRRNVPLRLGRPHRLYHPDRFEQEFAGNSFAWRLARRLEGREDANDSEGIWPINGWRCSKRFGWPPTSVYAPHTPLNQLSADVWSVAREMRVLGYRRVVDAAEALQVLNAGRYFRYATEITADWYDPPGGIISESNPPRPIIGSHAVPIELFESSGGGRFMFKNSWGPEWGRDGWGGFNIEHFCRYMIDAWHPAGEGLFPPRVSQTGIICLEWKWSLDHDFAIHGREIIDASTDENLAWAFCTARHGRLDVEEFYVWPDERGKGYGRKLAEMVHELSQVIGLPLRLLVSYGDTEPSRLDSLNAAARVLHLHLEQSPDRWADLVGAAVRTGTPRLTRRPARPAFILERLRPKDERPVETPIEYSIIYGTNRRAIENDDGKVVLGAERDSKLNIGRATVTIPRTHRFGSRGRLWLRLWNWLRGRHPRLTSSHSFENWKEVADEVATISSEIENPYNLLYVHGFNVSFDAAVVQAAQFGVDLKVRGTTFLYSWPSAGRFQSYMADEAAVDASRHFFRDYLSHVLSVTGDVPLNIIVHSMGNRPLVQFVESIARENANLLDGRINNVILAAPDVDADVFRQAAAGFGQVAKRTTLYVARADIALIASGWCHSFARAGLSPPTMICPGIDTVLVEDFNVLDLGHSYYAEAGALLHDMFVLLRNSLAPVDRPAIVSAQTQAGEQFWKLSVR